MAMKDSKKIKRLRNIKSEKISLLQIIAWLIGVSALIVIGYGIWRILAT